MHRSSKNGVLLLEAPRADTSYLKTEQLRKINSKEGFPRENKLYALRLLQPYDDDDNQPAVEDHVQYIW